MSKNSTLEKQNAGLRREVRKLESETKEKNSGIYALKEQTKYFKEQLVGYESAKKEIIQLKKKLEELRNIQMLLDAPIEDIKDIIGRDKDPATLLTYITIMKKETMSNLSKIRCLKIKVKNLQDEHAKLTMTSSQCYSNNRLLKEFTNCKKEKLALQTRVNELEKILGIAENSDRVVTGTLKNVKGKDEVTQEECLTSATLKKSVVKKRTHTISSPTKHNREHVCQQEKRMLFTIYYFHYLFFYRYNFFIFLKQIVSKSNIEKNDASSSIVEIMDNECSKNYSKLRNLDSDTSIPLKKTRFSKMHEETNDENDVLFDNSIENLLHICKHADTSTNAVSKASKEKTEREKSSKMKHHEEDIIDLT
ncbi:uncharacterized protein LOC124954698 isoform X3 [Vespa velutina]|nr:uncharacterized protein LOC124954698 isoform X3 [Vespa velutina]XP_047363967.1 uncharacterized protein LOC124954698 isoform X3 [Vespa velutina]